ncbi:winged helix-turn-helix transcriptional regulator [Planctomonas sp. JC2975]|uniref:winged helix-turn-helix transcriptional regulator n=1 Tax=Planctomonas sp. JC2975 TaxID=2729626 RepID=UPI003211EC3D
MKVRLTRSSWSAVRAPESARRRRAPWSHTADHAERHLREPSGSSPARTAYREVPPRVEYELTSTGRTLLEPARAIAAWAISHHADITEARARQDE